MALCWFKDCKWSCYTPQCQRRRHRAFCVGFPPYDENARCLNTYVLWHTLHTSLTHPMWHMDTDFICLTYWGRDKMAANFLDDTFNRIFVNENVTILIKFSLKFVSNGPINNIPALVQIMAWRRPGDKPLSERVMVSLLPHICVTRPQWVKEFLFLNYAPVWLTE